MDLKEFIVWLSSAAGASAALSFLAERLPVFQRLTPEHRSLVHLLGSLVIALGAYAILTYVPPEVLAQLTPVFQVIAGVVGTWIANQVMHTFDPAAKADHEPRVHVRLAELAETVRDRG